MQPRSRTPRHPGPALLAVPRSQIAQVFDLEDARGLARELDPLADPSQIDERATDILEGRLMVIRSRRALVLDAPDLDGAPTLTSLMGDA